ncbi:group II intron maturase-specific domain-containing protein [Arenibacter latericius]|uniref:group II intron maturase-specific domain-containing protein n=1 Tax=Arenibacter latericius TaxID=86104 RepID=UPI0004158D0C
MRRESHVRIWERPRGKFPRPTRLVVHYRSYKQLKYVESRLRDRFAQCKLELCPVKTKIVYCKDSNRNDVYESQSFDFLGYTFRPRSSRCKNGLFFVSFSPAVSQKSLKAMRSRIKKHPIIKGCYSESIENCARILNPIIRGWINYYGGFRMSSLTSIFRYINDKLTRWVMRKFKSLHRRKTRAGIWLKNLYLKKNDLFVHWKYYNWVVE